MTTTTTTKTTTISNLGFVLTTKTGTFAVLYDNVSGHVFYDAPVLVRGSDGLFRLTDGATPDRTTVARLGRAADVNVALFEMDLRPMVRAIEAH